MKDNLTKNKDLIIFSFANIIIGLGFYLSSLFSEAKLALSLASSLISVRIFLNFLNRSKLKTEFSILELLILMIWFLQTVISVPVDSIFFPEEIRAVNKYWPSDLSSPIALRPLESHFFYLNCLAGISAVKLLSLLLKNRKERFRINLLINLSFLPTLLLVSCMVLKENTMNLKIISHQSFFSQAFEINSLIANPNHLGSILVFGAVASSVLLFEKISRDLKYLLVVNGSFLFTVAFSLSARMAVLAGLVIFTQYAFRKKFTTLSFIKGITAMLVSALLLNPFMKDKFFAITFLKLTKIQTIIDLTKQIDPISMIFGHGPFAALSYFRLSSREHLTIMGIENLAVDFLFSFGILGSTLLLILFFKKLYPHIKRVDLNYSLPFFFLLINNLTDFLQYNALLVYLCGLSIFLIIGPEKAQKPKGILKSQLIGLFAVSMIIMKGSILLVMPAGKGTSLPKDAKAEESIKQSPYDPLIWLRIEETTGDMELKKNALLIATNLAPDHPSVQYRLFKRFTELKQYTQACIHFKNLTRLISKFGMHEKQNKKFINWIHKLRSKTTKEKFKACKGKIEHKCIKFALECVDKSYWKDPLNEMHVPYNKISIQDFKQLLLFLEIYAIKYQKDATDLIQRDLKLGKINFYQISEIFAEKKETFLPEWFFRQFQIAFPNEYKEKLNLFCKDADLDDTKINRFLAKKCLIALTGEAKTYRQFLKKNRDILRDTDFYFEMAKSYRFEKQIVKAEQHLLKSSISKKEKVLTLYEWYSLSKAFKWKTRAICQKNSKFIPELKQKCKSLK